MHLRPIEFPRDAEALSAFDAGYDTHLLYRVERQGLAFALVEERRAEPFRKRYDAEGFAEDVEDADFALAAVAEDGSLAGFACVRLEEWNRSAELSALFVAPAHKGQGLGRRLLDEATTFARASDARCLWLETQSSNHPAIGFYLKSGFAFSGLNTALYDPRETAPEEVALFFSQPLGA
ncbi:GNAT family N-acetyltransferase [Pseudomonas solani]|uniref:GNAT family N-acetyltransferase n=1 Tax=Pseudomonas solani TaxID=2731552 RepID=UPI003D6C3F8C